LPWINFRYLIEEIDLSNKKNEDLNKWDPSSPVEENPSYWKGDPLFTRAEIVLNSRPKVIELFCGLGGLSQGFIQAGFQLVLGADIHSPSIKSYKLNHPDVSTILGDLRNVSAKKLQEHVPCAKVDVLVAGVPCQGFSRSNRKRHDDDERNNLFIEFMRIAKQLKPKAVLIENVSSLRGTAGGAYEIAIKQEIEENLNLRSYVVTLNAGDYGVPQHRERVFFVGVPRNKNWRQPAPSHGLIGGLPYLTVKDAIYDLPTLESGQSSVAYSQKNIDGYAKLMRGRQKILTNHQAPNHPQETIERIDSTIPGDPMYPRFRQRIRLHWDRPSPTQVSGGIRAQFQFGHPEQARGLTIRERCRIQSFPDFIRVEGGLVQARIQTGNAVPPILAEAVARSILDIL
jgi:DNA (cytosine-5)-methyltransferase 1